MAFTGPRKGGHPEMETALANFVRTQRAAALPVTTEVLQVTARVLSREQGVSVADWLSTEDHQLTPTSRIKRASLSQLAGWVAAAWDDIPGTLIMRSFKKCGISNALDGTEDCALFEDSDKEISDDDSE
ncbi:hypothetical protein HPB52_001590 [Rhipicephalus sanguineus]|uniref:Uncharacterized protein n=1 Tax=Rhipicephalus sanguineus TaxID=34632 RepID=A0A9D4PHX8_RHISA|nr:hypothetical protein HPB52_001590 [Rhipicephalus sanguineus]